MSDDADWFEQALRDSTSDSDDPDDAESSDESTATGQSPETSDSQAPDTEASDEPSSEPDFAFDTDADTDPDPAADTDEGLFEEDFAAAFQGSDMPGGGDIPTPADSDQSETFADEAADSDIPRIDLGIDGLDNMIEGGVPERSLMVTIGPPGSGKTTVGMQFLNCGLAQGERGVYITLEEDAARVTRSAKEKGFAYDQYIEDGQLAVVDIDAIDMANSLRTIQNELVQLIEEFGATRLVLDSVSLLEMMFDDRSTRRNEIYSFTKQLKDAGVTTMLTSEVSDDNPYVSRHGIVEYLTDAVFVLQYIRPDDFRETRMAVEIQKIRDAYHSREKKPYEIGDDGISVYQQATIF